MTAGPARLARLAGALLAVVVASVALGETVASMSATTAGASTVPCGLVKGITSGNPDVGCVEKQVPAPAPSIPAPSVTVPALPGLSPGPAPANPGGSTPSPSIPGGAAIPLTVGAVAAPGSPLVPVSGTPYAAPSLSAIQPSTGTTSTESPNAGSDLVPAATRGSLSTFPGGARAVWWLLVLVAGIIACYLLAAHRAVGWVRGHPLSISAFAHGSASFGSSLAGAVISGKD